MFTLGMVTAVVFVVVVVVTVGPSEVASRLMDRLPEPFVWSK